MKLAVDKFRRIVREELERLSEGQTSPYSVGVTRNSPELSEELALDVIRAAENVQRLSANLDAGFDRLKSISTEDVELSDERDIRDLIKALDAVAAGLQVLEVQGWLHE